MAFDVVHYSDFQIKNQQGLLITSLHHEQAPESHVVPFHFDRPRHIFEDIIHVALR